MSNSLDTVIERHALARAGAPPSRARGVVLLIHGRGATAEDEVAPEDQPEILRNLADWQGARHRFFVERRL